MADILGTIYLPQSQIELVKLENEKVMETNRVIFVERKYNIMRGFEKNAVKGFYSKLTRTILI